MSDHDDTRLPSVSSRTRASSIDGGKRVHSMKFSWHEEDRVEGCDENVVLLAEDKLDQVELLPQNFVLRHNELLLV